MVGGLSGLLLVSRISSWKYELDVLQRRSRACWIPPAPLHDVWLWWAPKSNGFYFTSSFRLLYRFPFWSVLNQTHTWKEVLRNAAPSLSKVDVLQCSMVVTQKSCEGARTMSGEGIWANRERGNASHLWRSRGSCFQKEMVRMAGPQSHPGFQKLISFRFCISELISIFLKYLSVLSWKQKNLFI